MRVAQAAPLRLKFGPARFLFLLVLRMAFVWAFWCRVFNFPPAVLADRSGQDMAVRLEDHVKPLEQFANSQIGANAISNARCVRYNER